VAAMKERGMRRQMVGTVVSNKMDKTVVVLVERLVKHQMYHKYLRRRAKFSVHDADNNCQIGDRVLITESRPLSKNKRWQVSKIVEKAV
jgi:small subunit ribosomal protein S17